jgi:hypothetical protein
MEQMLGVAIAALKVAKHAYLLKVNTLMFALVYLLLN